MICVLLHLTIVFLYTAIYIFIKIITIEFTCRCSCLGPLIVMVSTIFTLFKLKVVILILRSNVNKFKVATNETTTLHLSIITVTTNLCVSQDRNLSSKITSVKWWVIVIIYCKRYPSTYCLMQGT